MVPTSKLAAAVAEKGGPPEYVEKNFDRLVTAAYELQNAYIDNEAAKKKK